LGKLGSKDGRSYRVLRKILEGGGREGDRVQASARNKKNEQGVTHHHLRIEGKTFGTLGGINWKKAFIPREGTEGAIKKGKKKMCTLNFQVYLQSEGVWKEAGRATPRVSPE